MKVNGMNMDEYQTYLIELRGQLGEQDLNEFSPIQMRLIRSGKASTTFLIQTDPSGLVGLIRCLHGQGFVLLSLNPILKSK
jgi:hypothetical protein